MELWPMYTGAAATELSCSEDPACVPAALQEIRAQAATQLPRGKDPERVQAPRRQEAQGR